MAAGEWEKAISALDLAESFVQESKSYEPSVLTIDMSRCREKLAAVGKLPADPLSGIGGWI